MGKFSRPSTHCVTSRRTSQLIKGIFLDYAQQPPCIPSHIAFLNQSLFLSTTVSRGHFIALHWLNQRQILAKYTPRIPLLERAGYSVQS